MSASDTRHSANPNWRITFTSTHSPPTITSARASSMPGFSSRSARVSVARVRKTSSTASLVSRKWWIRSRSYSRRPCSTAAAHETVPASPTSVRASATPGTSRSTSSTWPSTIDRHDTNSSGSGGSCSIHCSVRRTQPMSQDSTPSARVVPTTNSVDPPPMSRIRNGPSAGSRSAVAPANERRPSSSPGSSSGRTPSAASAASKNSSRLAASRAADVAVARTFVTP